MKKLLLLISAVLCLVLASCASTAKQTADGSPALDDFPYTSYNAKAGDDLYMPVNCNFLFYGKTEIFLFLKCSAQRLLLLFFLIPTILKG